jgi:rare lipoprotein A (peptidoglycan hydrolase)
VAVAVRINDRGPFVTGRIIDLSEAAARQIGLTGLGLVRLFRCAPSPEWKALPSSAAPTPARE